MFTACPWNVTQAAVVISLLCGGSAAGCIVRHARLTIGWLSIVPRCHQHILHW
jgi:hypothetical protein